MSARVNAFILCYLTLRQPRCYTPTEHAQEEAGGTTPWISASLLVKLFENNKYVLGVKELFI